MFLVLATACAIVAVSAFFVLPGAAGSVTSGYLASLRRLPGLYVRVAPLRLAAGRGTLWFFAFCAVWAGFGVALSQPPFSYSSERIGVYAFAGLLARRDPCGRRLDGQGRRAKSAPVGLVIADRRNWRLPVERGRHAGLPWPVRSRAVRRQVANQSTVLAIDPAAPAQFNSAYMLVYFIGGTLGTAFGPAAVGWFGWPTTAAIAAGAIALAMMITVAVRAQRPVTRLRRCPIQYWSR